MSAGNRTRRRDKGLLPAPKKCTAHRSNGDPCRQAPCRGGTVCWHHGGAAPQVQRKAKERLMEGVLPLLAKLYQLATDEKVPPAVRLAAIKDWLDRAGLNAKTTIELDLPWQQLLSGIVATTDEVTAEVRDFYNPDGTAHPTIEGEAWEVSDKDWSDGSQPGGHVERVTYPPGPQPDPDYPAQPRAAQPTDGMPQPMSRPSRRGRR